MIKLPNNRFDSPETLGKERNVKIEVAGERNSAIELSSDITGRQINISDPKIDEEYRMRLGAGVGILEDLDIELRATNGLRVKYQVLGDPRSKADTGNIPLAATVGLGYVSEEYSVSGVPTGSGRASIKEYIIDGALISGYRISKQVLFYGGGFYTRDKFHGDFSFGSVTGTYSSAARLYGGNWGAELGEEKVQFKIEMSHAIARAGSSKSSSNNYSGAVSWTF